MSTTTGPALEVAGRCRGGHFVTAAWSDVRMGWIYCPCGQRAMAKPFTAKTSSKKCNLRCTSSLGPSCSCQCGGRDHGSDHRA